MKKLLLVLLCALVLTGCTNNIKPIEKDDNKNTVEKETEINNEEDTNNKDVEDKDSIIKNYFDTSLTNIKSWATKENITKCKDKIKDTFITLTDFIFYDGEIKGIKFEDLKDDTKKYVLNVMDIIDSKIETVWPTYKEDISSKTKKVYTYIKDEIKSSLDSIEEILNNAYGEEKVDNAKEKVKEAKDTVIDKAKEAASTIKDKVSTWYSNLKK